MNNIDFQHKDCWKVNNLKERRSLHEKVRGRDQSLGFSQDLKKTCFFTFPVFL